jgi:outer membrane receptor protein involved in Fe transport
VDSAGAPISGARVILLTATESAVAETATSANGSFSLAVPPPGSYSLVVSAGDVLPLRTPLTVGSAPPAPIVIELGPTSRWQVTVTARRGAVQDVADSAQFVSQRERGEIITRPTVAHALEESPDILVQQTTPGQVSPFLRGLTGYHVVHLVDGVRFNNSTFRSGPNQYLAFIEPSQAERVEAVLGPAGVEYGSDALGGAIQVVTAAPPFTGDLATHGELHAIGATSDLSAGASAQVSLAGRRLAWLLGVSGARYGDLRTGRDEDSHNVYWRLFGMTAAQIRSLTGSRLPDTGYQRHGAQSRLNARWGADHAVALSYLGSRIRDVDSYKDLLGGLGRLQSSFEPQELHMVYGRYEKLRARPFDSLSATASLNIQRDGSTRQGLRLVDPVVSDDTKVHVAGYSAQGTSHIGEHQALIFGVEVYDDHIRSERLERRFGLAPVQVRPLYPDDSRYTTVGVFGHDTFELARGRGRASLGGRWTGVRYRAFASRGLGITDARETFRDLTFHSSVLWRLTSVLAVSGIVSRGFRAPNLNDLGAIGLNDLGYEIPAAEAIPAQALMGASAGENALSLGRRVAPLSPERLLNYELGLRLATRRLYARVQFFDAELYSPIVRRTLLFPASSPPATLGRMPVTVIVPTSAQREQGVVTVATALDPRAVKAFVNDGRAKYYGVESIVRYSLSSRWNAEAGYSLIVGRELYPNRNIRRLPPQHGHARLRYTPSGRRPWLEGLVAASGAQRRLSGGDLDDERIGASRSRRDIADFFNGAIVTPQVDARGVFVPTGETLTGIQNRVLPSVNSDTLRIPLSTSTPGWTSVELRGGFPLTEQVRLGFGVLNLFDSNYRIHGSGVDAPGRAAWLSIRYVF